MVPAALRGATFDRRTGSVEPIGTATGGAVTWTNKSDVAHNVVFTDASVKSSDLFDKGKSSTTAFPKAGAYPYICSIHPDMKATVVVR